MIRTLSRNLAALIPGVLAACTGAPENEDGASRGDAGVIAAGGDAGADVRAPSSDASKPDAPQAPACDGVSCGPGRCDDATGVARCECPTGFDPATGCEDIDECDAAEPPCAPGACVNTDGGFACSCPEGFEGSAETCTDIDECAIVPLTCAPGSCVNLDGGYTCECPEGYENALGECHDIDECLDGPCGPGECTNLDGSYACACPEGYEGTGACTDVDECLGAACGAHGTCFNLPGAYRCECRSGFVEQDGVCVDVDECLTEPCGVGSCRNWSGGYTCDCPEGYEGTRECTDVDECLEDPCPSLGSCENLPGTYECSCEAPWVGDHLHVCTRRAIALDLNYRHGCVVHDNGGVSCWGTNSYGQLGDGRPVSLGIGRRALKVVTGFQHTCALIEGNQLKCWGSSQKRLGDGSYEHRDTPEEMGDAMPFIETSSPIVDVASHFTSTYLALEDGTVRRVKSTTPIDVGEGTPAQLAPGTRHLCVRFTDGSVACTGSDSYGQLGGSSSPFPLPDQTPAQVPLPAIDLVSGDWHTCALLEDHSVRCWGNNWYGQLGLGSTSESGSNLDVDLGSDVVPVQLSAGGAHTCARMDDGRVKCWGANFDGALGSPDLGDLGSGPGQMGDALPYLDADGVVVRVEAGGGRNLEIGSTCVLLEQGAVQCWGRLGPDGEYRDFGAADLPFGCACDDYACGLTTQAEVEALAGCEEVNWLSILGSEVSSLAPLSSLQYVGGQLWVFDTALRDLQGLDALREVAGDVEIHQNSNLQSLEGLQSLREISREPSTGFFSSLLLYDNPALVDVDGLRGLTSVGSGMSVLRNESLEDLDGLANVGSVGSSVTVADNPSLQSVDGLLGIESHSILSGGDVHISDNGMLPTCDALQAAQSIIDSGSGLTGTVCGNLEDSCGGAGCSLLP